LLYIGENSKGITVGESGCTVVGRYKVQQPPTGHMSQRQTMNSGKVIVNGEETRTGKEPLMICLKEEETTKKIM
jgi:hypothetical protein